MPDLTRRRMFAAGLAAAGPALLILVLGRRVSDRPGLIEAISDGFSRYLPLDVFEALVSTLGPTAKGLLALGIAVAIVLAGGLLGWLALDLTRRLDPLVASASVALGAILVVDLLVLPAFGAGLVATSLASDPLALQVPIIMAAVVFADAPHRPARDVARVVRGCAGRGRASPATEVSEERPTISDERPIVRQGRAHGDLSRRGFIGRSLLVLGGAAFAGSFLSLLSQVVAGARSGLGQAPADIDPGGFGPTPAQTPVPDFYTVNKNLGATAVEGATWALVIDGLVDRPASIGLEELESLPYQEAFRTLECISTDIVRGDHLIGNQKWRGVRVSDLLDRVGPQPGASWILWQADDGFTESLPIDVARHPDTWIAYLMDDQPLTPEHGYPARVLIPGRFGMKQPKWVRRMQLADHDEAGYWEQRGWDQQAVIRTMSRIDWPADQASVAPSAPFAAYGIAFAGDRGTARVEVSPDGGATWLEAELEDAVIPPLGELTWVRWRADLMAPASGSMELVVRATDGDGATQSGEQTSPLPSGSTGWHRILVSVAGA